MNLSDSGVWKAISACVVQIERTSDVVQTLVNKGVIFIQKSVVPGPTPECSDRRRELRGFFHITRPAYGPEIDRAIGDYFMQDLTSGSIHDYCYYPRIGVAFAYEGSMVPHRPKADPVAQSETALVGHTTGNVGGIIAEISSANDWIPGLVH